MSKDRVSAGRLLVALLAAVFGGCSSSSSGGGIQNPLPPPPPPPGVSIALQQVFVNLPAFTQPLAMMQAPMDSTRWFVLERAGQVRVFDNDPAVNAASDFIDISDDVDSGPGEAGLLGMAFHPNFQMNGEVFLSYTRPGLVSYISRFTSADGGLTLDPTTEVPLLTVNQDSGNHNGGNIAFSPLDGFLYIGLGDGGGAGDQLDRAQTTTNLLGAMLRIDVNAGAPYAIPLGNMFVGNALCNMTGFSMVMADCPEIFAWGLRNPWRWGFDQVMGDLWVGDVGQGAWEEVDLVVVGGNYGWRIREGAHCFNPPAGCATVGLIDPVAEYDHGQGISVTGGFVYRGTSVPGLVGSFVYGDFGSGRIWALVDDGMGNLDATELIDSALGISSFGQANDGEIYVLDYFAGQVYQIAPAP